MDWFALSSLAFFGLFALCCRRWLLILLFLSASISYLLFAYSACLCTSDILCLGLGTLYLGRFPWLRLLWIKVLMLALLLELWERWSREFEVSLSMYFGRAIVGDFLISLLVSDWESMGELRLPTLRRLLGSRTGCSCCGIWVPSISSGSSGRQSRESPWVSLVFRAPAWPRVSRRLGSTLLMRIWSCY